MAESHYIAAFFNALRRIGFLGLLSTNFNNQAGINTETLSAIQIPVPPLKTHRVIANEINRRREEARRLRSEAEAEWSAAKERFEERLLGD